MAEIGQLSGRPDLSAIDARAVDDVEAIFVPPEALRALLVAEAELGERILRALILRRVALIEIGFGGPVHRRGTQVPRRDAAVELPRTQRRFPSAWSIPTRIADGSALLARFAPTPVRAPDRGPVRRHGAQEPDEAGAGGAPWAWWRRASAPNRTTWPSSARVRPVLRPRSTARPRASPSWCWKRSRSEDRPGASARIENYLGFPTGVSGQALMGRAFTQAQKFGAEFSLSTEVKRVDCTSERSGPDPVHILELADGRRVRARAVVVATGARYRRPEIPEPRAVRGPRRLVLGVARRGAAVPQRGRGPAGWRKFGGAGRRVPRQPRAPRARAGAPARPGEHDVALPHRSDRGLPEHRGALRHRDRGAPRHARPRSAGRAVAQPAHRCGGAATLSPTCSSSPAPIRRQLAQRLRHPHRREGVHPDRYRRGFDRAGRRCRWRPASRGSSPSATSVAAR